MSSAFAHSPMSFEDDFQLDIVDPRAGVEFAPLDEWDMEAASQPAGRGPLQFTQPAPVAGQRPAAPMPMVPAHVPQGHPAQARPPQAAQPHPGHAQPGYAHPGQPHPGQAQPGYAHPGQPHPGQPQLGQPRQPQQRPPQPHPSQAHPGLSHAPQPRQAPPSLQDAYADQHYNDAAYPDAAYPDTTYPDADYGDQTHVPQTRAAQPRAPQPQPQPQHSQAYPPVAIQPGSDIVPVHAGFNPVGDMVASAAAAMAEVSVPRIAIHVFAERQDTLDSAERAGQDRRLSRATTQIRIGGVTAAIDAYQQEPTPPLIVVEHLGDAATLLRDVDRLAEVCDTGTKVVVIGAANDIILFRELMRRGVSEYLVAPLHPLQLISAIGALFADPAQPFVGRSIAFVGARGGTGSSAVAHNTAYAMSERIGANTVIVDYDLPFGTAGLDFNQDPLNGVADALTQPDRLDSTLLDRMMVRCTDKLSLFAAPATLDGDWDISPDAFEEVTTRIRSTAPFVVLDLPHLWSGWMRRTLISSDEVVVVATPDLASLRNAKNMIDLIRQGRPNDAPPRLVLNQVGVPGRPEIPAKDFGNALGVHPCLIIPFDPKLFGLAANNGQMILDAGAKSKAAEAFQTLAQIVSRRELPLLAAPTPVANAKATGKSLFGQLFKTKR